MNERPQRQSRVTAVHHHAHALYGLCRAAGGGASGRRARRSSGGASRRVGLQAEGVGPHRGATVQAHTMNAAVR